MTAYQYLIYYTNFETGDVELVQDVTTMLANSEEKVKLLAFRKLSDEWVEKIENLTIEVKPFSNYYSYGSPSQRLTITSAGNVGIGASSPQSKLCIDTN